MSVSFQDVTPSSSPTVKEQLSTFWKNHHVKIILVSCVVTAVVAAIFGFGIAGIGPLAAFAIAHGTFSGCMIGAGISASATLAFFKQLFPKQHSLPTLPTPSQAPANSPRSILKKQSDLKNLLSPSEPIPPLAPHKVTFRDPLITHIDGRIQEETEEPASPTTNPPMARTALRRTMYAVGILGGAYVIYQAMKHCDTSSLLSTKILPPASPSMPAEDRGDSSFLSLAGSLVSYGAYSAYQTYKKYARSAAAQIGNALVLSPASESTAPAANAACLLRPSLSTPSVIELPPFNNALVPVGETALTIVKPASATQFSASKIDRLFFPLRALIPSIAPSSALLPPASISKEIPFTPTAALRAIIARAAISSLALPIAGRAAKAAFSLARAALQRR